MKIGHPHRLFQRQIKRYFGDAESLPENVRTLMQAVNDTYFQFDQDRAMLERAFDLSSEEMVEANRELLRHRQDLERIVEERTRDLVQSNDQLSIEVRERQKAEKRLALLNECLLSFGIDSTENIRRLVALCGNQFQAQQVQYGLATKDSFKPMAFWQSCEAAPGLCPDEALAEIVVTQNSPDAGSDLSILYPLFSGPFRMVVRNTFNFSGEQKGMLLLGYEEKRSLNETDREYLRILIAALQSQEERRQVKAELHLSEEKFSFMAKTAQDGIIVANQEGCATFWNPAAERIFGYSREEVLGKPLQSLLGPPAENRDFPVDMAELQRSGTGPLAGSTAELKAIRKDGTQVRVEISVSATRNARDEWNTLNIVRDITERKRWEESLQKAKEAAESASKAKSQFLANMSHEIRTPLNGILGMMELLSTEPLSDRQMRFLQMTRSSGDALLSVINDILDFSKIEAGRMELSLIEFDLRRLLEDVTGLFTESANRKGLELMYVLEDDVPLLLFGDAYRIRQILVNLVGNGIKFTERGEVVIRVAMPARQEGKPLLKFQVSDTGIGLPEQMQQNIFDAFSQADGSVTRRFGGTGLGLAIAKQLAQMMGGAIGVESEPGRGSTFWFTIRVEEEKTLMPENNLPVKKSLDGLRVLVVDDNETNLTILCHQLNRLGAEADRANSGRRALHMLQSAVWRNHPYHFAILDVMMPGMNGFDLARVISMDSNLDEVRLVMLASPDMTQAEKEALGSRIDVYLTKPISQTELLMTLSSKDAGDAAEDGNGDDSITMQPSVPSFRGRRILLVEDNEVNQVVGKAMLESLDCTVEMASNGHECLQRIGSGAYDLILMDCQMPELDGYETTAIIRQQESGRTRIPILALTAHAMEGDREACLAAGMDDYLSKPFTSKQLSEALHRLISPAAP
ncbi:MAG: Signal transduction histidine-protein kinase BarA [Syntrophus sp. PtaU1.Bin208]|nr:MAG: Signal transduction histidine-protein kinase BarA [Syntrophus sp. PtaU1.Bin208]